MAGARAGVIVGSISVAIREDVGVESFCKAEPQSAVISGPPQGFADCGPVVIGKDPRSEQQ